MRHDGAFAGLVGMALALATGGCDSPPKTDLSAAVGAYERGRYRTALEKAEGIADKADGEAADQARYLAGVSAVRLGKRRRAVRLLRPVADGGGRELQGRAHAAIGLLYKDRKAYRKARKHLDRATDLLSGEEHARAAFHLGVVEQRLGQWDRAGRHLRRAASRSSDKGLRQRAKKRVSATAFTLQVGAFSERTNARERAEELRSVARDKKLGSPRIVKGRSDDGGPLYRVQTGRFDDYRSARKARRRLDASASIIVPHTR